MPSRECAAVQVLCQQRAKVDSLPEASVQHHPEAEESEEAEAHPGTVLIPSESLIMA